MIRANGVQLEFVKNYSYLGIVLDNKLQFNDHITNNIKKAGHKVYTCYQESDNMLIQTLL